MGDLKMITIIGVFNPSKINLCEVSDITMFIIMDVFLSFYSRIVQIASSFEFANSN